MYIPAFLNGHRRPWCLATLILVASGLALSPCPVRAEPADATQHDEGESGTVFDEEEKPAVPKIEEEAPHKTARPFRLPGFLFGLGLGGVFSSEMWGGGFEIELDAGRDPHYFAFQFNPDFGSNDDAYGTAYGANLFFGYRGYYRLTERLRFTLLAGPQVGWIGLEEYYTYYDGNIWADLVVARAKAVVGIAYFIGRRFSVGIEIGGAFGMQYNTYWDEIYSSGGGILRGHITL